MKSDLPILVVDDDAQVRGLITEILRMDGWRVTEAKNAKEAFEKSSEEDWALVFCDVMLGDINGYTVLERFISEHPKAKIVLMTGYESAAGALDATATGAYDYLVKPFSIDEILAIAASVREQYQTDFKPAESSNKSIANSYHSDISLIGRNPAFVESMKLVGRIAATNLPILITGESGTGKEMVAKAIHQRSRRAPKNFIAVNCGAIPVELIESELFGHSRGSFTGADRERIGLWEEANGGTLFLDEITETHPQFQIKILRALQQGEIRRVGSNQTIKVNVRIIAATNREILEEVREGRFRQDLMYRLNAVTINLPPLRERVEDIPILAEHFTSRFQLTDIPVKFSPEAMNILKDYFWRGNIRELENAVLHAVSLSDQIIYPEHLPIYIQNSKNQSVANEENSPAAAAFQLQNNQLISLAEVEEKYVMRVLEHTGGNKQAAARILNIDRKTLTRIVKRVNPESLN